MKISELEENESVLARQLEDPEFRAHWEATALARLVARRLVAFRAEKGLSQSELATLLGFSQARVSQLESGDTELKLTTIYRLVDALGIEIGMGIHPLRQGKRAHPIRESFTTLTGSTRVDLFAG